MGKSLLVGGARTNHVGTLLDCSSLPLLAVEVYGLTTIYLPNKVPGEEKRFFVIGCYREHEMAEDHPAMKTVVKLRDNGIKMTMNIWTAWIRRL